MGFVRYCISMPSDLKALAQKDAAASGVRFSTYIRLLIEQRLGVAPEPAAKLAEVPEDQNA
jgi:hypothetical protein